MQHILVCDDEEDIVAALKIYLEADGYCVHAAYTGADALKIVREEPVQLALMDIMMPGMDGITAMAKLREFSNIPVILLTAKSEDSDKILGLSVGADDYITKPFNPVEVLARVKSQLRRFLQLGAAVKAPSVISVGGIELDHDAKRVTLDGEPVAHAEGIRHSLLSHAAPRQGLYARGALQRRVERGPGRDRQHRGGTHPPSAREAGDRPVQSPLPEGRLG